MSHSRQSRLHIGIMATFSVFALSQAGVASASAFDGGIPAGWVSTGNSGTLGADGVVTTSPEGGDYGWVSTLDGTSMSALGLGGETSGSTLRSGLFSAEAGDSLEFFFNYVTTDGAGYADYAWARLLDESATQVALLFTARTTPSGNSVPGFGMPVIEATINPSVVTIVSGAPSWTPVGSGCWSTGCGYTGWIESTYTIADAGNYFLEFGVVNWSDDSFQSGLAFDGITVGGDPINPAPEPASLALMGLGLAGLARFRRKS